MAHHDDERPQILVGMSFDDAFRAQEFLTAATRLAANGDLKLVDAVLVSSDANGHTVVKETTDPQPARTAFSGAVWAGLFGLMLGGPVGWLVGGAIGAGAGAVTARLVDLGIPDEWVAWFRDAVQPGKVTVALLVTDLNRDSLVEEAGRFVGATLVYANLESNAIDRIKAALGEVPDQPSVTPSGEPLPPPTLG